MSSTKTQVKITADPEDGQEYKKGDIGYIDGYMRGGNHQPCAVVIVKLKMYMVPIRNLSKLPYKP